MTPTTNIATTMGESCMSPNTSIGASGSRVLFGSPLEAGDVWLLLLVFRFGSLGGNESIIYKNNV